MSFISRYFGYRWSLRIMHGDDVRYLAHENSVIRLVSLVSGFFLRDGKPRAPWRLNIFFNRGNSGFDLKQTHYVNEGYYLSPELVAELKNLDAKYGQIRGAEPVAVNARTKKHIPLFSFNSADDYLNPQAMRGTTLSSVLNNIFSQKASDDDG